MKEVVCNSGRYSSYPVLLLSQPGLVSGLSLVPFTCSSTSMRLDGPRRDILVLESRAVSKTVQLRCCKSAKPQSPADQFKEELRAASTAAATGPRPTCREEAARSCFRIMGSTRPQEES